MKVITNLKRKRAIKSYIKKLPKLLAKDYGKSGNYTPKQVRKTIERSNLSVSEACYGIAMFSTKTEFNYYHQEIGEKCDYDAMRSEIADDFFDGNADFSATAILSVSREIRGIDSGESYDINGDDSD